MGNVYTEGFALIVGVGADLPNTVDDIPLLVGGARGGDLTHVVE